MILSLLCYCIGFGLYVVLIINIQFTNILNEITLIMLDIISEYQSYIMILN